MPRKRKVLATFIVVIALSILLLILSNFGILNSFTTLFSKITYPVQKSFYNSFGLVLQKNSKDVVKDLENENLSLRKKILDQQKLQEDNRALRDQFQTSNPKSSDLLPAKVLAFPSFIPNVSFPETIVIDKGRVDGVKEGQAIVYKDNLVGRINKVMLNKSLVLLVTNPNITFTAKVLNSNSNGVVKGLGGGEMVLDNVLLSDNLKKDEIVLTKGDLTNEGTNFPADLIVGKIIAIDKNPSALFQTAGVESLIKLSNLETVFIYLSR